MERQQENPAPDSRVVWCETHESFSGKDCLGPDCVVKQSEGLAEVEEGGA